MFCVLVYKNTEHRYSGVMARRTAAAIERSAVDALIGALESLGVEAELTPADAPESDFVAEVCRASL